MTDQQPTTNQTPIPVPGIVQLREFLTKAKDAAIESLSEIKVIENDEQYEEAKATLVTAKALYDKMSTKRKAFTEPIRKMFEELISYENEINYTSDKENQYNRARKVLEGYDQKKLQAAKLKEHEAWLKAEQLKYKAEYKAKVMQQLADMIAGLNRTLIDQMTNWERALTLANVDEKESKLRASTPVLKQEHYDNCFRLWGAKPNVMTPKEEENYLAELKAELTFAAYNEKYQQIAAPIKNEYLAKMPVIKQALQEQAKASAEVAAQYKAKREQEMEAQKQEALKKANELQAQETQAIKDEKDLGEMNAEFTQQMLTADVEKGPIKKIAYFVSERQWLQPFLQVVSKVGAHPKFKGITNPKGEYVPEIDKWLKFFAQYIGEEIPGITFEERAKTLIKK